MTLLLRELFFLRGPQLTTNCSTYILGRENKFADALLLAGVTVPPPAIRRRVPVSRPTAV